MPDRPLSSVLESADWQKLNAYNHSFAEALAFTNDYWHLPQYSELLEALQDELSAAVQGKKTVEQALSDAAGRHEAIFKHAGHTIQRSANPPEVPDQKITPVGQDEVQPLTPR